MIAPLNIYKNTKVHSNADGPSRLPLVKESRGEEIVDPVCIQFDTVWSSASHSGKR